MRQNKKNLFRITLMSLMVVALGGNAATKKTPAQYWQETGIKFSEVERRKILTNENCYKSKEIFFACYVSLNTLALYAEPARTLLPVELLAARKNEISSVEAEFSRSLALAKLKLKIEGAADEDTKKTLFEVRKEEIAEKKALQSAVDKIFQSKKIDIAAVYKSVLQVSLNPEKEGLQVSEVLNTYLNVAVDPHTRLTPRAQLEDDFNSAGSETFFGIGVSLKYLSGNLIVERPLESSPAEKAGVRANDIFLTVNNKPVKGMKQNDVVELIRGPANTEVVIQFQRGTEIVTFKIVRGPIETKNVTAKMLQSQKRKIGYVKLNSFMDRNGCLTLGKEIISLQEKGASALILDLRGNPGGLITEAACVGGLFLGEKVIVTSRSLRRGGPVEEYAGDGDAITSLPLVTLQDAGSASASEIVAGALQDYKYGWIMGERSYGKGTVQQSDAFTSNIAIFATIARFHQPSGRTNQIIGILPNFEVPAKPNTTEEERFRMREEDSYTNALPPISEPWKETRPTEVAELKKCMRGSGVADKKYAQNQSDGVYADYQLLHAQDLLDCVK